MARPSYSQSQVQEIEERIHAAALKVFAAEGYRNFSLRAVAREMGLTPPALYRYVDNKDSLLAEVRAEGFRHLGEIFREVKNTRSKPRLKARKLSFFTSVPGLSSGQEATGGRSEEKRQRGSVRSRSPHQARSMSRGIPCSFVFSLCLY